MNPRRSCLVILAGLCVLFGLSGCDWKDQTGFVEIRKGVSFTADDHLILNSKEIANIAQKDHAIIQEHVGTASLELKRGEKSQKLCDIEIRKDRVVTVTITYVNPSMRCAVQS
jgi:hypothetical protein